jgi:hypothetical protein
MATYIRDTKRCTQKSYPHRVGIFVVVALAGMISAVTKRVFRTSVESYAFSNSSEGDSFCVPEEERWTRKHRYNLDEVLAGITPESLHEEISSGDSVGREVW